MGTTTTIPPLAAVKHLNSRGKLPLSITTVVICVLAFIGLMYSETIIPFTSKLKFCSKRDPVISRSGDGDGDNNGYDPEMDDRFEFDPEECSVMRGKWVFNSSYEPPYTDRSCPYLDRQFSCVKNGRPDSDYQRWQWQPDDCLLTPFDPEKALNKLRGKRLMFVGDSLQRGQWESFVCLVESIIPEDQKSMKRGRTHSVFKAEEYNATIEFYWSPFLVESNSDRRIVVDPKKRILKVDSILKHAKHWTGVDILVFNTYVWWTTGLRIKSLLAKEWPYTVLVLFMSWCRWGSFANGEEGYEELDLPVAYRIALKTWANWVDSTINPNETQVFFTTMSPTHMRSADWNNKDGIKCFNETKPVMKKNHWGTGSDKRLMKVVSSVVEKMKVPVTFINITQLSEYRIDGHSSIYTETGGKLLTDEQKADPLHHADCIHWCLPGVPDAWNQIFYAHL